MLSLDKVVGMATSLEGPNAVAWVNSENVALGYWNGFVRIHNSGNNSPYFKKDVNFGVPVLDLTFNKETNVLYAGLADGSIQAIFYSENPTHTLLGKHDGAVKVLQVLPGRPLLVSAGLDQTIKFWDFKNHTSATSEPLNAVYQIQVPGRCFALHASSTHVFAALSTGHVAILDYSNTGAEPSLTLSSSIYRSQLNSICAYGEKGYIVGCGDGSVFVHKTSDDVFRFKAASCPVVSLTCLPKSDSCVTASKDGNLTCWNLASKNKLRTLPVSLPSVSSAKISEDGQRMVVSTLDHVKALSSEPEAKDSKGTTTRFEGHVLAL